jgi:ERCC4-type nuclease
MIDSEGKNKKVEAENIREILGVVSSEVPALIKSLLASVFSEEAGRSMGKAAAAYYKELKQGGMPEEVAVKMTQDYMRTFTSLGDMLRSSGRGKSTGDDIGEEIERKIREKLEKKTKEREQDEDDEDE